MGDEADDNVYAQERKRAHEQRWATPGNDPFEQWYWKLQRYFNRRVDPEIQEVYRKLLSEIAIPELDAVFEDYILRQDTGRDPPKVNQIYVMWKDRKDKQQAKRRARDKRSGQVDVLEERDSLRRQMFPLVCSALLGPNKYYKYSGDAPVWMSSIAAWAAQQFRTEHPDEQIGELTQRETQSYFDRALELFENERSQHEEHIEGYRDPDGDSVREP